MHNDLQGRYLKLALKNIIKNKIHDFAKNDNIYHIKSLLKI